MAIKKRKLKVRGIALILVSYLVVGGVASFTGYIIGEDAGLNKITVVRDYKTKGVVAVVNGKEIPQKELKVRMDVYSELYKGKAITEDEIDKLEASFIEYVATSQALCDEATKQKVSLTDEELSSHYETTMNQVLQGLGLTEDRFLTKFNVTSEYLRESISTELLASKLLNEKVKVTESDIKKAYEKDTSAYSEIRASHILITNGDGETKDDATLKKEAEDILAKIKDGEDFEELAKKYSKDGSASSGGDLDYFSKGQMVEEFEKAAFSLKTDEVYPSVVKTDFGYHIIKKTDEKEKSFDDVKEDIESELLASAQDKYIQGILDKSKIEIKVGLDKGKKIQVVK